MSEMMWGKQWKFDSVEPWISMEIWDSICFWGKEAIASDKTTAMFWSLMNEAPSSEVKLIVDKFGDEERNEVLDIINRKITDEEDDEDMKVVIMMMMMMMMINKNT